FKRSRFNYALVQLASRLCTRSPVYRHDAVAQIRSAFSEHEFSRIAHSALARPIYLRPLLPCYFLLVADERVETLAAPAFA
ncbi:MAG: methyltransferase, partial [Novipirellula sp. JB048]